MIQVRRALPYWFSIFCRKSRSVVLSAVLPRHHLVGQGKAFRRDHQGNDHLHAVAAFVAAVAEPPLVAFGKRRIAFKIGARQIVEQHIEAHPKEIVPALAQKPEERLLVLDQTIQATIKRVLGGQRKVLRQQIAHGALVKPHPVQPPFAARIQQTGSSKDRKHVFPVGALARAPQPRTPKLLQTQLLPQLA